MASTTADSISGDDATDQINAFAAWSSKYSSRKAVLFVPKASSATAQKNLTKYDQYCIY